MEALTRKAGFEALADIHTAINDVGHRLLYYTGGGVLYIQTRGSKSQKHYAEKFSALGEDILQIIISDRDAVVRGVTKERSEERRVGKGWDSTGRSRWLPDP